MGKCILQIIQVFIAIDVLKFYVCYDSDRGLQGKETAVKLIGLHHNDITGAQ